MARLLRLKKHLLFVIALALACGPLSFALAQSGTAMVLETDPVELVVSTGEADIRFRVEIADTPFERQRGLMFRKSMPDNHGMLFEFDETRKVAMWMKNTYIPLDMVFIGDDGRINAIRRATPHSLDIVAPETQTRFVLELNAGITGKNGIAVGAKVRHPVVDAIAGRE